MRLSKLNMMILHFLVTSIFFYFEAIIHYNIGKKSEINLEVPTIDDNKKMICIILSFSLLSSLTCYFIEEMINK